MFDAYECVFIHVVRRDSRGRLPPNNITTAIDNGLTSDVGTLEEVQEIAPREESCASESPSASHMFKTFAPTVRDKRTPDTLDPNAWCDSLLQSLI